MGDGFKSVVGISFNTQPPEGGCAALTFGTLRNVVSTHSRPKAADKQHIARQHFPFVSTHSRPKAAAGACSIKKRTVWFQHTAARRRLQEKARQTLEIESFNTQPPEGGWGLDFVQWCAVEVSTHSRPKAAEVSGLKNADGSLFQHTAARRRLRGGAGLLARLAVSTHSRPKAAGGHVAALARVRRFQHTAARRRLASKTPPPHGARRVSTHSRPKAAGTACLRPIPTRCFNTQPPEGG